MLSSDTARATYIVSTSPQNFAVPFYILNAVDIAVVKTVAGVDTTLSLNTNFTVTGAGTNPSTALVVGITGAIGATITITRGAPATQPTTYVPNDKFPAATLEQCLDRLTMLVQQLVLSVARSLRIPNTNGTIATIPLTTRKNKVVGFDNNGDVQLSDPMSGFTAIGTVIEVSSYSALRALSVSGLITGIQARVSGYSSSADGGDGLFVYNSPSSATDNDGTVLAPGVGSGRWLRCFQGATNVRWFGAKGDGVSNDTSKLQAAMDFNASLGRDTCLFIPAGLYLSNALDFSAAAYQTAFKFSIVGEGSGTRLVSTVAGANPFIKIGELVGYGVADKWLFRGLSLQAQSAGNGNGIQFEALAWHPKIEDCNIEGFQIGLLIKSAITPQIINCRIKNCTVYGLDLPISTTGNPALDQSPTTARILNTGFANNPIGINKSGIQALIDGCVFEGNTTYGLKANFLGEGSVVSNTWHEGEFDRIDGGAVYVSFINVHGIMSDPTKPLFTNPGSMFDVNSGNNVLVLKCGSSGNQKTDSLQTLLARRVQATEQFYGVNSVHNTPGATGLIVITDAGGNDFTPAYQNVDPIWAMCAVHIIETNATSGTGRWEYTFIVGSEISTGAILATYTLFAGTQLTAGGVGLISTPTSTQFAIPRDASGKLAVQWANRHASTTKLEFRVRPIAAFWA